MIDVLLELTRVVAYGGIGGIAGFACGLLTADHHRIANTITNNTEAPMPNPPARRVRRSQLAQTVIVVLLMVAMLGTGVNWMQSSRQDGAQDRRDCLLLAAVSERLQARSLVVAKAIEPERQLWIDLRKQIRQSGVKADAPTVVSIDRYLKSREEWRVEMAANPYPAPAPGACGQR